MSPDNSIVYALFLKCSINRNVGWNIPYR